MNLKPVASRQKTIIFSVAAITVSFVGGLAVGFLGRPACESANKLCGEFAEGWNAARQKLNSTNNLFAGPMGPSDSLGGRIKDVGGDRVIFTAALANPLDDESLKERTALVTDKTEIILRQAKTEADLAAEEEARAEELEKLKSRLAVSKKGKELIRADEQLKKLSGQVSDLQDKARALAQDPEIMGSWAQIKNLEMKMTMPEIFSALKEIKGGLGDMKPGLTIWVEAGEDIGQKQEFTAKKIVISENYASGIDNLPANMPLPPAENMEGLDSSPYGSR